MTRILLIDDDPTTNFIHQNKLKKQLTEVEIVCLNNGLEALNYCQENSGATVAFLDLNMPVMDGLTFLNKHNELPPNQKINTIVLFTDKTIEASFKAHFNVSFCIEKPLNQEKINLIFNV